MRRNIVVFVLSVAFIHNSYAQNFTLKGILKNSPTSRPVKGATVSLKKKSDTTEFRTGISDTPRKFSFNSVPTGSFNLTIISIGFNTIVRSVIIDSADVDLKSILLQRNTN